MPGGQAAKCHSRPFLTVANHLFHFSSVSVALVTQREWSWGSQPCRTPPSKLSVWGSQWYCSDMLNTFLKTGNDGDTSFSVFTVALKCYLFSSQRTDGHPTFINIICIIHSQVRIETSVLVCISTLTCPSSLKKCFWTVPSSIFEETFYELGAAEPTLQTSQPPPPSPSPMFHPFPLKLRIFL